MYHIRVSYIKKIYGLRQGQDKTANIPYEENKVDNTTKLSKKV